MRACLILLVLFSGCVSPQVIYKCPKGQVMILEDRGLPTESEKCYSPGVSYTDYRPLTTERVNSLT